MEHADNKQRPELGQFAIQPGPMMAAFDIFEIEIKGRGAHAGMPHLPVDPIVAAASLSAARSASVARADSGCRRWCV